MKKIIYFELVWMALFLNCNLKSQPPLFVPAPKSPFAVGNQPADVALVDVNSDNSLDVVTVNYDSKDITVLLGDGKGNFTAIKNSLTLDSTTHLVVIGDVNNDKKPDLLISYHHNYGVTILLGDGKGKFSQAPGSPFSVLDGTKPHNHGLAIGDVNKDGNLDFVTSNHQDNNVSVMLGGGKGNFKRANGSPFAVGRGPYPLAVADINNDGNLDIATPNLISNDVTVLLGNGKGDFKTSEKSPYPVLNRPFHLATGDLNGDKKLDLVTTHDDINEISILLADSLGGFAAAPSSPLDIKNRGWKVVIADMNQDSLTDLVICNTGGDYATVMLGDGKGNFKHAPSSPYKVGRGPTGIAVGDLNSDGKKDMVVANSSSNNVTVLLAR